MLCKRKQGLITLAIIAGCLAGCAPGPQANLSPDGKTVALTNNDGIIIHDTTGNRPEVNIKLDQATSPLFSPDSKYLAVCLPKSTLLIDRATHDRITLPAIAPPYAWKPDGTELVGFRTLNATVVHIQSRSVVRSYRLPQIVDHAAWFGSGRDMVFGGRGKLYMVKNGKVLTHQTQGDTGALAVDASRKRVLWAEVTAEKPSKKVPQLHSMIKQIGIDFKSESLVLGSNALDKLMSSAGRAFAPGALELSPDGNRLAVTFFVDASRPGLMEKYAELGGFEERPVTSETRKRLNAMAREMRLRTECITTKLDDTGSKPSKLYASADSNIQITSWSQDGNSIAVVEGSKVTLEHANP